MKIFNHKQLLIILKPKYNYPIICKLIIQQLRKDRFKFKQNKLLNNLLKYIVKCYDGSTYNRFDIIKLTYTEIIGGIGDKYISHDIDIFTTRKDNALFDKYRVKYHGMYHLITYNTLIELMFDLSVMSRFKIMAYIEFYHY